MHTHEKCGKCGSAKLLLVPETPGQHSHIVFGERVLQTVAVTTYVCTDCGFIEQWVNSKDELMKLKEELVEESRRRLRAHAKDLRHRMAELAIATDERTVESDPPKKPNQGTMSGRQSASIH